MIEFRRRKLNRINNFVDDSSMFVHLLQLIVSIEIFENIIYYIKKNINLALFVISSSGKTLLQNPTLCTYLL